MIGNIFFLLLSITVAILGLILLLVTSFGLVFIGIGVIGIVYYSKKCSKKATHKPQFVSNYEKQPEPSIATQQQKNRVQEAFNNELNRIPRHEVIIKGKIQPLELSNMPEIKTSNITSKSAIVDKGDFVVLDVETTGINPYKHRIIELSAIKYANWEPTEIFSTLINPKIKIPNDASMIHGIYDEDVSNSPTIDTIMGDFIDFIGKSDIVGHNVRFDLKFLYKSGFNFSIPKSRKIYDTMEIAKYTLSCPNTKIWDNENKTYDYTDSWDVADYKLTTLCDYYYIRDNKYAHRSDSDTYATAELLLNLIEDKLNK